MSALDHFLLMFEVYLLDVIWEGVDCDKISAVQALLLLFVSLHVRVKFLHLLATKFAYVECVVSRNFLVNKFHVIRHALEIDGLLANSARDFVAAKVNGYVILQILFRHLISTIVAEHTVFMFVKM